MAENVFIPGGHIKTFDTALRDFRQSVPQFERQEEGSDLKAGIGLVRGLANLLVHFHHRYGLGCVSSPLWIASYRGKFEAVGGRECRAICLHMRSAGPCNIGNPLVQLEEVTDDLVPCSSLLSGKPMDARHARLGAFPMGKWLGIRATSTSAMRREDVEVIFGLRRRVEGD